MIVADASVLANAVGDDGSAGDACRGVLEASDVAVPDLAYAEVASMLRRAWVSGHHDDARLRVAFTALADLPLISFQTNRQLLERVYELRENVTPYDAMYVALAESLGVELHTGDRHLARAPGIRCTIHVIG